MARRRVAGDIGDHEAGMRVALARLLGRDRDHRRRRGRSRSLCRPETGPRSKKAPAPVPVPMSSTRRGLTVEPARAPPPSGTRRCSVGLATRSSQPGRERGRRSGVTGRRRSRQRPGRHDRVVDRSGRCLRARGPGGRAHDCAGPLGCCVKSRPAARSAAHWPRAAPVSSPESSGTNSTVSARVAEQPLDAGMVRRRRGRRPAARPGRTRSRARRSVELLARDQHHVLAVRPLQVEVVVGLGVGVEVEVAHEPEQLVDAEPVGIQAAAVAEQEVECREPAAFARRASTVRRSEPITSSGSKPRHQQVEEALGVGVARGRAVGERLEQRRLQDRAVVAVGVAARA